MGRVHIPEWYIAILKNPELIFALIVYEFYRNPIGGKQYSFIGFKKDFYI